MKISGIKFAILVISAALSVAITVAVLCLTGGEAEFTPPPFESHAALGVPSVPEGLGYGEVYRDGMSYRFSVCGNVTLDGEEALVYLTNPKGTGTWLKLRVLDQNGKLRLDRAELAAYAHGDYFALGRRLGNFGFSAVKKKKRSK